MNNQTVGVPQAVAFSATEMDLNQINQQAVFRHTGCSTGTLQIALLSGSDSSWEVTVERSNDGMNWAARATPLAIGSLGFHALASLDSEYTRVRVSTLNGAAGVAAVSMFARA